MKRVYIMFSIILLGMCLVGCSDTLSSYKLEMKYEIDSKIQSMNSNQYTSEDWDNIINMAIKYKSEIDDSTSFEDIKLTYSEFIKKIRGKIYSMKGEEKYTAGDGTQSSPYVIDTLGKLIYFANQINQGEDTNVYVQLGADIDLEYMEWIPIGIFDDYYFNGVFDGQGYEIKNLQISERYADLYAKNIGLFGYNTGEIRNIGITNMNIHIVWERSEYELSVYVGGLVGCNIGIIENCYTIGNIDLDYSTIHNYGCIEPACIKTGGLVGPNGGRLNECYSAVNIRVNYSGSPIGVICAGGLASYYNLNSDFLSSTRYSISNCFVTGSVSVEHLSISSNQEEFWVSATPEKNCYVYDEQMSSKKCEDSVGLDYFCTEEELNDINFYIEKLGWNPEVWCLDDLDFSNGKYLDGKYPKLNRK